MKWITIVQFSVLPVAAKFLERVVHSQLYYFLGKHQL